MKLWLVSLAWLVALQNPTELTEGPDVRDDVVVASKPFGESYLLAEMAAQLLEHHGITVRRRLGLGTTEILFQAMVQGEIDLYPEYTGTALQAILREEPSGDARSVYRHVASESSKRWSLRWLPPLGFENLYAVAARRETAERLGLTTLSSLAAAAGGLTAGLSPDFVDREDGLIGLKRVYGLEFGNTKVLLQAIKYQAIASAEVDVIDAYSTDGALSRHDLVVLDDDLDFFPPYEAAFVTSARLGTSRPQAIAVLSLLSGKLDEELMRSWNSRVEIDQEKIRDVARSALGAIDLVDVDTGPITTGRTGQGSFMSYFWSERELVARLTREHLVLVAVSMSAAIAIALPLGLLLYRLQKPAEAVIGFIGVMQTLPGIALLAFMVPLFGIGALPAIVALFFYSVFPILRNTYTGLREADRGAAQAAWSLGMTPRQLLLQVRLPLAVPVIMAGIRTATVLNVGTSTLAAFIGGGGLGDPIVRGLALSNTWMILSGAIPAAILAFAMDGLLSVVGRLVSPRGLRESAA